MTDHDIDRRFRELIQQEYGNVGGSGVDDVSYVAKPAYRRTIFGKKKPLPDPIEYFNLEQAIDNAVVDDEPGWTPPPAEPIGRLPRKAICGLALMALSFVCSIIAMISSMAWLRYPTVFCFAAGLIVLLTLIPRSWGDSSDSTDTL